MLESFARMGAKANTGGNPAAPRRPPQGPRGEGIVDAIISAASRVLKQEGYDKLTTNRIAEIAGVSIGSLYQYFPGKQAVIAAIARRLEQDAVSLLGQHLTAAIAAPLRLVTQSFVRVLASHRFGNLNVRRELLRHVPRAWTEDVSLAVDQAAEEQLARHLEARTDVREADRGLMAFILVHAVEAVVEAAVMRRHDLIDDPRFIEELTELVTRYLERP